VFGLDAAHRILESKRNGRNEVFVNVLSMLRQRRGELVTTVISIFLFRDP